MNIKVYRKKRNSRVALSILLSIIILSGVVVGSLAITPLSIYALPPALLKARTVGELILTILAGAGTAVTNPTIVPGIYAHYDLPSMSFESLVTEGILLPEDNTLSTQEAIEQLGTGKAYNLDVQAFRDLMNTNWQTMKDNNLDTVFRMGDIANTDATYGAIDNIGQILKNVAENGYLSLENSVAIVSNPGTAVSVGLDKIKDSFLSVFRGLINSCLPLNSFSPAMPGYSNRYTIKGKLKYVGDRFCNIDFNDNVYCCSYYDQGSNYIGIGFINVGNDNAPVVSYATTISNPNSSMSPQYFRLNHNQIHYAEWGLPINYTLSPPHFSSKNDATEYLNKIKSGDYVPSSPDVVNNYLGNLNQGNIQDVNPVIDNNQGIDIIDSSDYNNFLNDVSVNNNQFDYLQNANDLQTLLDNNIVDIPAPPVIPDQPTIVPKPTVTPEEIQQSLSLTTKGLQDVFPFCIPFDIAKIVEGLEDERQAPHIIWSIDSDIFGHLGTIDLDLSVYDSVAAVCRILELILFIVGLMLITNNLIGRSG